MSAQRLILAGLIAVMPLAAAALSVEIAADCVDGETEYRFTEALPGGLLYTGADWPDGAEAEYLISCEAGRAVRAEPPLEREFYFMEIVERLAGSAESYTFDDVAKLAREAGYTARVVSFSKDSCLCQGDWN